MPSGFETRGWLIARAGSLRIAVIAMICFLLSLDSSKRATRFSVVPGSQVCTTLLEEGGEGVAEVVDLFQGETATQGRSYLPNTRLHQAIPRERILAPPRQV